MTSCRSRSFRHFLETDEYRDRRQPAVRRAKKTEASGTQSNHDRKHQDIYHQRESKSAHIARRIVEASRQTTGFVKCNPQYSPHGFQPKLVFNFFLRDCVFVFGGLWSAPTFFYPLAGSLSWHVGTTSLENGRHCSERTRIQPKTKLLEELKKRFTCAPEACSRDFWFLPSFLQSLLACDVTHSRLFAVAWRCRAIDGLFLGCTALGSGVGSGLVIELQVRSVELEMNEDRARGASVLNQQTVITHAVGGRLRKGREKENKRERDH